jgi:hypothetical protein
MARDVLGLTPVPSSSRLTSQRMQINVKTEAPDINRQRLMQAVNSAYGLRIKSIFFTPKGEDAYNYVAFGPEDARYFLRAQATERAGSLNGIYGITYALRERFGLPAVVAPRETHWGTFTLTYDAYTVAVFDYIGGRTLYEQGASDADLCEAADILAALHETPAARDLPSLQRETFENPFRATIVRALQVAEDIPESANTYHRQLATLLNAERGDIIASFDRMDELAGRARQLSFDCVLTHGDPNLDNLLKDKAGRLHLTDWGEVALGPPERDLFMFTGAKFETFLRPYVGARRGVALHPEIFAFYFYRWAMQEIADYTARILFGNMGPVEDEHAWAELQPYLPIQHNSIARGVQALQEVLERVLE